MEISEIITELKSKFGDTFDISKVTEELKGVDMSKLSFTDIIGKLKDKGLLGDLDGEGVVESPIEELKGKATKMFGSIFGK